VRSKLRKRERELNRTCGGSWEERRWSEAACPRGGAAGSGSVLWWRLAGDEGMGRPALGASGGHEEGRSALDSDIVGAEGGVPRRGDLAGGNGGGGWFWGARKEITPHLQASHEGKGDLEVPKLGRVRPRRLAAARPWPWRVVAPLEVRWWMDDGEKGKTGYL